MTDDTQPEPANECWPWELEMEEYERQMEQTLGEDSLEDF
jgi:hypothetical protein